MRLDQETIERIKQAAQVADVIGDYVSLKKKGANLWACCPFHGEKSPSFSVSPAKGIYKCFGCGKAGDSVRFIMDIEGLGYGEALRHLAKKYNIAIREIEDQTDEELAAQNAKESLLIALKYAKDYYKNNLFSNEEGQSIGYPYLKERGFSDGTIQAFELGYSLDSWDAFTSTALRNGFNIDILEKAGLTIVKSEENKKFDRFRNRVIFPIHNLSGKTIAFGARVLKTTDKKQPKYLNSPETDVYHKSQVLYGIYQAQKAIRAKNVCYLVEGYTDVISLYQAGIQNVVASSGTSLTAEQIQLIARFTDNITVLYDGDTAGIKASLRGMEMILEEGLNVKLVTFPEGDDPDSYVKKIGEKLFLEYVDENSVDFVLFKSQLFSEDLKKDPTQKSILITDIVQTLIKIKDLVKLNQYTERVANILNVKPHVLEMAIREIAVQERVKSQQRANEERRNTLAVLEQEEQKRLSKKLEQPISSTLLIPQTDAQEYATTLHEQECIRLLINHGTREVDPAVAPGITLMQYVLGEIDGLQFNTPIYQEMLMLCRQKFLEGTVADTQYFLSHPIAEIQSESINLVAEKHSVSEAWLSKHEIFVPTELDKLADMAYTNILRLKKSFNDDHLSSLMKQLAQTKDPQEQNTLLMQFMQAKEVEKQIAKELGTVVVR